MTAGLWVIRSRGFGVTREVYPITPAMCEYRTALTTHGHQQVTASLNDAVAGS